MAISKAEAIFSLLDREVWLLTTRSGNRRAGLVVTLVSQASIVPEGPRVWVGLSPQHHTTGVVLHAQNFLLQLVGESHFDVVWKFGTRSGHDEDKFAGAVWEASARGHPRLRDPLAWLECTVESHAETGDRVFFLARVVDADKLSDGPPMTLHQFRRMLSPEQNQEINRNLARDACIDADLIRRWNAAGYRPLTIAAPHGGGQQGRN
jgi:flavin reductase (DIM6/NTAB) family NADH-FMN oxidoreductase RutF